MTAKPDPTPLHAGHRARLRERFEHEPAAVADYEVLELLLSYGLTRKDTKPLAKLLLQRFGNIRGVMEARPDELQSVPGFGPGLMTFFRVMRETRSRHDASAMRKREVLATPQAVARMAQSRLAGCPHEECWLALVDQRNRLTAWECLRRGGVAEVSMSPREVFETALLRKASGIIMVHNHPGGNPAPSEADKTFTAELQKLAPQLGLRFLDHVIVTEGDCYSITQMQTI